MTAVPDLVDSHAHVHAADFPDRAEVLVRARAAGVRDLVFVGSGRGLGEAREAVELARAGCADGPRVFAAVGIHPHDVARMAPADWDVLAELARDPVVVGVGETGLDYHYQHSPPEAQRAAFSRFGRLAREVGKPLVVHVRDAHADARAILSEAGVGAGTVIHCFTGTGDDADAYLALGCALSLSGIVTFKSADALRAVAARVPTGRLLLETDCPYLAPVPLRGRRNEPAFLAHTAAVVARARGVPVEQLAAETAAAARALFRLPPA